MNMIRNDQIKNVERGDILSQINLFIQSLGLLSKFKVNQGFFLTFFYLLFLQHCQKLS